MGAPYVNAKEWWKDNPIIQLDAQEYFDEAQLLGDGASFGGALDAVPSANYPFIRGLLERVNNEMARQLILELDARQCAVVDRTFLASFGRFWGRGEKLDLLVEPEAWRDILANAEAAVTAQPPRSLLASGDTRIGKTSFLRLLAKRLEPEGWTVFEAGGADLMAGQQWFGQLEGRIQKAVEELSSSKKLIWYIPDILQIALSGTHQGQAASILEQILPAISAGRLIVWTEASPAGAARLLRLRPQLRNVFELIRFEPLSKEETLTLAQSVTARLSAEAELEIDPACADTALISARQYLSSTGFPGSVLDLLKSAITRAVKGANRTVTPHDVIASLSQVTGVPAAILDSKERADLASIRKYFAARVMGQDEAVSTDGRPDRDAEGGPERPRQAHRRLSFRGADRHGQDRTCEDAGGVSFRLGGQAHSPGHERVSSLRFHLENSWNCRSGHANRYADRESSEAAVLRGVAGRVRESHANVWDLFLQVFDDARLTDAGGQEADFRHCIIILTTNLGATSHRSADLGFLPGTASFSNDQVLRAVSQTFRPEFQNRLDKVIVFQPLTRELMRSILKKELARVLERRGFKDREWAVEWEASALEFLLEKGFSPEMGARPLKRAIDQYVIAPLAATIVERRFPEGDQFVFVRSDGKAIQAEFVDPDSGEGQGAEAAAPVGDGGSPALPAMILTAKGDAAELRSLEHHFETMQTAFASDAWEEVKAELAAKMQASEFWAKPERYEVLARLALMDRVRAASETAESFRARLVKAGSGGKSTRELVARLALQLHLIGEGIKDVFEDAPIEAVLSVEPALDGGADRVGDAPQWCGQLLAMYRGWAAARNMQLSEVMAKVKEPPLLVVGGFGAYRTLSHEAGLHVLEMPAEEKTVGRITARAKVAPAPLGEVPPNKLHAALAVALSRAAPSNVLIRRYRNGASPLVRDMVAGWRTGRLDAVLSGDFDLIGAAHS